MANIEGFLSAAADEVNLSGLEGDGRPVLLNVPHLLLHSLLKKNR
jgi:hypothetical protein